jgi:histidine ammonia-lyase
MKLVIDGEQLTTSTLINFSKNADRPDFEADLKISPKGLKKIKDCEAFVKKIVKDDAPVYGVNTGFGKFAEVKVSSSQLNDLQEFIIRSHSCGVGEALPRSITLAMWIMRLNVFARGNSGIRAQTVEDITQLIRAGILSEVPSRGSVGASGDLCPSAHAVLGYLGEGYCSYSDGKKILRAPAGDVLKKNKIKALKLGPKEGLALINGTQLTTVLAAYALEELKFLLKIANLSCALMMEGLRGSHRILYQKVLDAKNQKGVLEVGKEMQKWLTGKSEIAKSHEKCGRVQDNYSLRCAPLVHGAIWDELEQCEEILNRELNSSSDNPLLFPDSQESVSGGNFHALYPARVADRLTSAAATLANIAERRIATAMNSETSRLPTFLTKHAGLHSGYMMIHVTAAALVSEAKTSSFPASVDSIPTNDDREDHVSMGPIAGFKALHNVSLLKNVLTIELMTAAQAIDLLRPLKSTPSIERVHSQIRKFVDFMEYDRSTADDLSLLSENLHTLVT